MSDTAPTDTPQAPSTTPAATPAAAPASVDIKPAAQVATIPATGDPVQDVAYLFLANNGITPGTPAWDAAQAGNYALAKAELAAKGIPGGAEHIALLEKASADKAAAEKAQAAAVLNEVHGIVGGEENWKAIKEFAAQVATDEELAAVNAGLKQGGLVAKAVASYLGSRYEAYSGRQVLSAGAGQKAATPTIPVTRAAPQAAAALSREQYVSELNALKAKYGAAHSARPEFFELNSRRAAALAAETAKPTRYTFR